MYVVEPLRTEAGVSVATLVAVLTLANVAGTVVPARAREYETKSAGFHARIHHRRYAGSDGTDAAGGGSCGVVVATSPGLKTIDPVVAATASAEGREGLAGAVEDVPLPFPTELDGAPRRRWSRRCF